MQKPAHSVRLRSNALGRKRTCLVPLFVWSQFFGLQLYLCQGQQTEHSFKEILDKIKAEHALYASKFQDAAGFEMVTKTKSYEIAENGEPVLRDRCTLLFKLDRASDSILSMSDCSGRDVLMSHCRAMNRKYEFELEKENAAQQWKLIHCHVGQKPMSDFVNRGLGTLRRPSASQASDYYPGVITVANGSLTIAKLDEQSGFKLISAVHDAAKGQIIIHFSYQVPEVWSLDGKRSWPARAESVLTLDAKNCCLPIHFTDSISAHGERHSLELTQENRPSNGRSVRTKTQIRLAFTDGKGVAKKLEEFIDTKYRYQAFPDSDFTLTAFGLPEPAGIEWEKEPSLLRFRTWGVALFVALCCLMALIGILRSRR